MTRPPNTVKGTDMMIRDFLNTEDGPMDDVAEAAIPFPRPEKPKPDDGCKCDLNAVDRLPVGITYASMQAFRNLYSPEEALCRGTLFCELDLPFRGGKTK